MVRSLALCVLFATQSLSVSLGLNSGDTRPSFNWDRIRYVHAFGDSYSFVQGTEGHANFRRVIGEARLCAILIYWSGNSFIGDALNFSFSPQQLLRNEIILKNVYVHISFG